MTDSKIRAERNRTIYLTQEQENNYLKQCITRASIQKKEDCLNNIIYGDFFDFANCLPRESVDLLIADPPYNLDKKFGKNDFHKMNKSNYEAFTRRWIESLRHSLKDSASAYICCDWETSVIIGAILSDYFYVQNRITWQREKGRGAKMNWKNAMEDIWFVTVSKKYCFNVEAVKQRRKVVAPYRVDGKPKDWQETESGNFRDTYPSNFWDDISIPYWSMPENTDHPTQKPEKLYTKLILASSNLEDIVLDPFAGVGTAAVVAKKLGRQFICVETEAEYCALAKKRLELAEFDQTIQGYADNVFWERNSLSSQKKASKNTQKHGVYEIQESLFRNEVRINV